MMGWSSGRKREMKGSSTSLRKPTLSAAILSRTSCAATAGSVVRSNSAMTCERPSNERELTVLMPLTVLTASSTLRVMSDSTVSGDAPG